MKKHKVEIPEGYEVESTTTYSYFVFLNTDINNNKICTSVELHLKPIKKQLPKTWEEYCEKNEIPLRCKPKYDDEFAALKKLIELRDLYNDGWKPDWNDCGGIKPIIEVWKDKVRTNNVLYGNKLLSFKTHRLRDEFLSNLRELIETAKPLL